MTVASQPLFVVGPGYCATALAAIWAGPVTATVREMGRVSDVRAKGMQPVPVADTKRIAEACAGAHILISAPPGENGCPALALIGAAAADASSVTYLSTTGVYGDLGGGWAFEWSPVNPGTDRARRRVDAEEAWRALRADLRIVRLPGIYGPGRSALDRVRAGTAQRVIKPGQVFSRAHVDDIATALKALMLSGPGGVFHVCDEEAAPPQDVIARAAELLGAPLPPDIDFKSAELSAMARSFYSECKRVSNARLKAATGWRPAYPTFREGLADILAKEG